MIAVAAALQMAQIQSPSYAVTQFCAYFVFFYVGYAGSVHVFRIVEAASSRPVFAWTGLALWALVEAFLVFWPDGHPAPMEMHMGLAAFPPLHLVLAVAGAIALCTLGCLLMKLPYTEWLRWLGEHSIVVYLVFVLPMSFIRIALEKVGIVHDISLLSFIVIAGSILVSVALYGLTQWTGYGRFLFERPAWAHIPGTKGSRTYCEVAVPAE